MIERLLRPRPGYYANGRDEVAGFVPAGCRMLLDVGCGNGEFGARLKRQRAELQVWGVEIVADVAAQAASKLDKVVYGDILQHLDRLPDRFFDCVTFNDSLEHLADPFTLLERMKGKLSAGGAIVSSIPNVRYYSNLGNLLFRKQWRYENGGILDRTHLRFFTEQSIVDMYREAGYAIELMQGINRTRKRKVRLFAGLSLGWLRDIQYQQFLTIARPA